VVDAVGDVVGRLALEVDDDGERSCHGFLPCYLFSYRKKYTGLVAKSSPDGHEFLRPDEYGAWNGLLLLNRRVLSELDDALSAEHQLAVSEFDVLITLYNATDQRLRMSELAGHVMLSNAGLTHLVTRLERDGLVRRVVDPADGRKWFTVLTAKGDARLRDARRTHNDVLRRTVLQVTTAEERKLLAKMWVRLRDD
jgi:DNA-binding MarR family transcriptional regulator